MQRPPTLLATIRRLERIAGSRLEAAVGSGRLTPPMLRADGAWRGVRRTVDGARGLVVHGLYLPTLRDVRHLSAAVARLEAEVRELSVRTDEREGDQS